MLRVSKWFSISPVGVEVSIEVPGAASTVIGYCFSAISATSVWFLSATRVRKVSVPCEIPDSDQRDRV